MIEYYQCMACGVRSPQVLQQTIRVCGLDGWNDTANKRYLSCLRAAARTECLCRPEGLDRSDIVDPYVKLQLAGFEYETKSVRTASVSDNGLM